MLPRVMLPSRGARWFWWRRALVCTVWAGAILVGGAGATGCVARARGEVVYDYPVAEVDVVPVEIETYPRVYYGGVYVYLVGDRWYYRGSRGWVVFREEPRELYRYRTSLPPERRVRRSAPPPRSYPRAPEERGRRYYPR